MSVNRVKQGIIAAGKIKGPVLCQEDWPPVLSLAFLDGKELDLK